MAKKKSANTEEKLTALLRTRAQRYLRLRGVTSVGVGYKAKNGKKTGELCIQFTVAKKVAPEGLQAEGLTALPESIEDDDGTKVLVDVIERSYKPSLRLVEASEALSARQQRRRHTNPIQPGISVSHIAETAGTVGAIVVDNDTGQPYVLSNWHVLMGPTGKAGDVILQPGPFDGGDETKDVLGRLVRSHLGLAGDCAIATIEGRAFDPTILELDVAPRRIGKVNLDDKVVKSGRTTGVTHGIVVRVGVVVNLDYGGDLGVQQIGGFEIHPDPAHPAPEGEISKGGDSGSVWLFSGDEENRDTVVGLHFAGESDPDPSAEHALACNIHSVLEKLNVSLNVEKAENWKLERLYEVLGSPKPRAARAGEATALEAEAQDPPPLNLQRLEVIERLFETDPNHALETLGAGWEGGLTRDQAISMLAQARMALQKPESFLGLAEAQVAFAESVELPEAFNFPGMDLNEIPINPGSHKFEEVGDALGWIVNAGWPRFFPSPKAPFRNHHSQSSRFDYPLQSPGSNSPLEMAVLGDFGTGLYHSKYIAKQLRTTGFPYALHLGDVYYAGRKGEFDEHFDKPLSPILPKTELFMLNSNHEMFSGSRWYFNFIDLKKRDHPNTQRQEGSYFRLRYDGFQIVGVDTAYHRNGRFPNAALLDWLEAVLAEGKRDGCANILLSADHPYEYGKEGLTELLTKDLGAIARNKLIDLWFWGNTHYCALFDRTPETPFIGCCVGHGGFPYRRKHKGETSPASVSFIETAARFPASTKLRQDMGNNGYCVLGLQKDGAVSLRYLDWMTNLRCTATLSRASTRDPLTISSVSHGSP